MPAPQWRSWRGQNEELKQDVLPMSKGAPTKRSINYIRDVLPTIKGVPSTYLDSSWETPANISSKDMWHQLPTQQKLPPAPPVRITILFSQGCLAINFFCEKFPWHPRRLSCYIEPLTRIQSESIFTMNQSQLGRILRNPLIILCHHFAWSSDNIWLSLSSWTVEQTIVYQYQT